VWFKPCLCFCEFSKFETVFDAFEALVDLVDKHLKIADIALVGEQQQSYRINLISQIACRGICLVCALVKATQEFVNELLRNLSHR
jgi:hypothetical protein